MPDTLRKFPVEQLLQSVGHGAGFVLPHNGLFDKVGRYSLGTESRPYLVHAPSRQRGLFAHIGGGEATVVDESPTRTADAVSVPYRLRARSTDASAAAHRRWNAPPGQHSASTLPAPPPHFWPAFRGALPPLPSPSSFTPSHTVPSSACRSYRTGTPPRRTPAPTTACKRRRHNLRAPRKEPASGIQQPGGLMSDFPIEKAMGRRPPRTVPRRARTTAHCHAWRHTRAGNIGRIGYDDIVTVPRQQSGERIVRRRRIGLYEMHRCAVHGRIFRRKKPAHRARCPPHRPSGRQANGKARQQWPRCPSRYPADALPQYRHSRPQSTARAPQSPGEVSAPPSPTRNGRP